MNETLRTVDGRGVLRMERRLAHPPEKVWRAITEPAHLSQWFPSEMKMDLRVGGRISFDFREGEGPSLQGVITELDPHRVFAYSWGDDLLRWELEGEGEGCLLILTHTFDDRPGAASFAAGWHVCIAALGAVLDGRPVEVPGDMAELHETYIEAFGMAEGAAKETADGWRVRFERQLTRPIEKVWATLSASGPGAPTPDASTLDADAPVVGGPAPEGFTTENVQAEAVTAVDAPTLLEYEWRSGDRPGGRVRWELSDGTGHGARLVLTQTGPSELAHERSTALAAWQAHVELLAKHLAGTIS